LIDLPGRDLDSPSISFVRDDGQVIELQNKKTNSSETELGNEPGKGAPKKAGFKSRSDM